VHSIHLSAPGPAGFIPPPFLSGGPQGTAAVGLGRRAPVPHGPVAVPAANHLALFLGGSPILGTHLQPFLTDATHTDAISADARRLIWRHRHTQHLATPIPEQRGPHRHEQALLSFVWVAPRSVTRPACIIMLYYTSIPCTHRTYDPLMQSFPLLHPFHGIVGP